MTHDQAKKLVAKLAGLFPNQLTRPQADQLMKDFLPFDVSTVDGAIVAHRQSPDLKDGRWDYGTLIQGIRDVAESAKARATAVDTSRAEGSFADVIRRQWAQVAQRSDAEVYLRYYRAQWHRFKASAFGQDATAAPVERHHLWRECSMNLTGCEIAGGHRLTLDEARQWAEAVFVEDVEHFRQVLCDLRGELVRA